MDELLEGLLETGNVVVQVLSPLLSLGCQLGSVADLRLPGSTAHLKPGHAECRVRVVDQEGARGFQVVVGDSQCYCCVFALVAHLEQCLKCFSIRSELLYCWLPHARLWASLYLLGLLRLLAIVTYIIFECCCISGFIVVQHVSHRGLEIVPEVDKRFLAACLRESHFNKVLDLLWVWVNLPLYV